VTSFSSRFSLAVGNWLAEAAPAHRLKQAVVMLAVALVLPIAAAHAQDDSPVSKERREDAAAAAAQAEAEAQARAEAAERARVEFFTQLQAKVRALHDNEAKLGVERVADARKELENQQRLEREQVARRDTAERRSTELNKQWDANDTRIKEMTALLEQRQGNLGELFGVTRQIAGDAAGTLENSMLSVLFQPQDSDEKRVAFMRRIAAAKSLPSIGELQRIWFELQREMTAQGQVFRLTVPVAQLDGSSKDENVVMVGPFTAVSDGRFLGYLPNTGMLSELDGQLAPNFRTVAQQLQQGQGDGYAAAVVDPARGALITRYMERPTWIQRVELGEAVGYVIIAVGIIGVLVALFQYGYLIKTRIAVSRQLNHLNNPTSKNPLGRLVLAFRTVDGREENPELAELRLSEAVLREVPGLQRFQSFLRLAVAAGPLLGLIGTVIGMIITFHAIVASGASDPKLMAHGIGQAMIATVLGLGIAIPLLFINSGLTWLSRGIVQTLDEQSDALLAQRIRQLRGEAPATSA
jgi:biopolymer transport protein ExbB